ncbi:hypothetical protein GCM10010272_30850 [Streptomyces lateritius]|nr:hypothetical protein GCM10010272_30850 [Streptomyces lateritius]
MVDPARILVRKEVNALDTPMRRTAVLKRVTAVLTWIGGMLAVMFVSPEDVNDTDHRKNSSNRSAGDQKELVDCRRKVPDSGRPGDRRERDSAEEACAQQRIADLNRDRVSFGLAPSSRRHS